MPGGAPEMPASGSVQQRGHCGMELVLCNARLRIATQQPHCASKPGGTNEPTAGLQTVQVIAQRQLVADQQRRIYGVAGARQLCQEQFAQGIEVMLLAVCLLYTSPSPRD